MKQIIQMFLEGESLTLTDIDVINGRRRYKSSNMSLSVSKASSE